MKLLRDTMIVYVRELRPTLREPLAVAFNLGQPLIFLLLFGPLLGGLPGVGDESAWQWFVPGILVMIGLFSTAVSGYGLLLEMQTGSHERLLVTPLNRSALLIGRSLKEIVPFFIQSALIIAVVLPMGFKLYPLGVLVGMVLLGAFAVGLGALSYALAIAVKDQEWVFWMVHQTLPFPLLILAGMFLPLELGPAWMQLVSKFNPLTYIIDAERALFAGEFGEAAVVYGVIAAFAMAIVGLWVGTRTMDKATF
jgi:ABC-2 type transport system permease protein